MPLPELYHHLLQSHHIASILVDPIQPPYPRWYNPNETCEYHGGATGHSLERCTALKKRIATLIKHGWIVIKGDKNGPNINHNPLPAHEASGSRGVNAIEVEQPEEEEEKMSLNMPMKQLFHLLVVEGYIFMPSEQDKPAESLGTCEYCRGACGGSIDDCEAFR